ncbi:MAG: hypothetical protein A2270_11620 [Elusimicrobia bacterium RIFOXYA12_FULL_51_18]|nr:MAG: hypothetical protein A2270_11620 [Elusimicrobia bacterium RIFOXYA12_FULL_51_18]OGS28815.1 MAG: hypothetical protein A2218_09080 [Elusimicrobia bacterium RIFOXYA2_FULL_53_38]
MIKKWEVAPSPSEKNPTRHKFLIKGEMKDIFLVVKKLGGICSRPEKMTGDFNFVIYLSRLEPDTLSKIKSLTSELSDLAETHPPVASAPAPVKTAAPAPEPFEPPRPKIKITFDEPPPLPVPEPNPYIKPDTMPAPGPVVQAKAPQAAPPPAAAPPVFEKSKTESSHGIPFVPSAASRVKAEEPKPDDKPKESPSHRETPKPSVSSRTKAKWSVELPLIPTHSFQTLVSGSHNRFAHAAATAVVENPGVMYNPLLIFGVPGTGKTHFVHAISYGLSSSIGQNNIFVTDGIKLSKGVDMAVKDGSIGRLEEVFAKAKVLIIDDVHLLMLNENNTKYISKLLNECMTRNKQIVVTSVFPPKSLGGLEEAVGFQLTQGWMVDLKAPAPQVYKVILNQLLQGMEIKLSDEDLSTVFANRSVPLGEAIRILGSMKKLEKFTVNAMSPSSHVQLLDNLLGLRETENGAMLSEEEYRKAAAWNPGVSNSWLKWGLFYPKGMKQEAQYVLYKTHERSVEMGLRMEWQQLFMEEYTPDELYGIPFKIANFASEKNANGVIILGPQPTSALGAQEMEFRNITMKILDSFLVKGAWVQSGQLKSPAAYAKILMDLI